MPSLPTFFQAIYDPRGRGSQWRDAKTGGWIAMPWFEHFVSGLFYCTGKKFEVSVLSYAQGEHDFAAFLYKELEDYTTKHCSPMRHDFGYSVKHVARQTDDAKIYPNVVVTFERR